MGRIDALVADVYSAPEGRALKLLQWYTLSDTMEEALGPYDSRI